MMKKINIALLLSILFSSCTKVIEIDLNANDPKIVVEGFITDEAGPYFIKLSETVNFASNNAYPAVQGAIVKLEDNFGQKDTLVEVSPGLYKTKNIQGISGHIYTLSIVAKGKNISAVSAIPNPVLLDSISFLKSSFGNGPGNADTEYVPIPRFTDPITFGNCYRFVRTVNDTLDRTFYVDNDNLINGLQYQRPLFGGEVQAHKGDSILFEMQCIDKATYDYFNSLNASLGLGPGGGTTPSNPVSNVQGGNALGYFSAHTVQRKKVLVK
jgi:Domain of unknown function (DUF4249)